MIIDFLFCNHYIHETFHNSSLSIISIITASNLILFSVTFQFLHGITLGDKMTRESLIGRRVKEIHCKICDFLGYYAAYSGNSISTFRDNLSVQNSRVKDILLAFLTLEGGDDMLSRNMLHNISEESRHLFRGGSLKLRILSWPNLREP
jgi:hypothetical protein